MGVFNPNRIYRNKRWEPRALDPDPPRRGCPCQLALSRAAGHRLARISKPLAKGPPLRESRRMKIRIHVSLKNGVLDPQGRAIHHALEGLGFAGVNDVRAGRLIELDVADTTSDAALDEMCRKLLANQVIENFRIEKVA